MGLGLVSGSFSVNWFSCICYIGTEKNVVKYSADVLSESFSNLRIANMGLLYNLLPTVISSSYIAVDQVRLWISFLGTNEGISDFFYVF